eukprot:1643437-Pyramimonas_sp.AAC.1
MIGSPSATLCATARFVVHGGSASGRRKFLVLASRDNVFDLSPVHSGHLGGADVSDDVDNGLQGPVAASVPWLDGQVVNVDRAFAVETAIGLRFAKGGRLLQALRPAPRRSEHVARHGLDAR